VSVPFAGMFGFSQAMAALAAGATMVTSPIFDSEDSIRLIRSHSVTHMVAADIMVDWMLAAANVPDAFASVKFCAYANFTPGLDDLGSRAVERGLTLVGLYGSSEVQALFARQSETAPLEERVEKGGQPVSAEAHVRARDVATGRLLAHGEQGELEIKAPSLMIGYFGNPKAFAEAITDVARLDDSLRLGGFLVNPAEIEGVVQEHPSVKECQIVGVEYGNEWRAFAFVIAKPGQLVKEPEIISHCQRCLSKSKVPLRVHQIEAFPVTESANAVKIQKGRLRELAQRLLS
jgi:fatty-acyl-CoA synthase